jgi:glucosamine--fructose-6-phosphate aminotransferase (isomerizing)
VNTTDLPATAGASQPGAAMLQEIEQQAGLADTWARAGGYPVAAIADAVQAYAPDSIALIARGTSDNAAGYAKYLLEILGGYLVSSTSPSTMTLYGARPRPSRSLCIAVSQSGQSPDLVRTMAAYREAGSLGIAVTNHPGSPLAANADHVIDLAAGTERAVAATKTFTCELLALLDLATAICGTTPPDRAGIASAITSAITSATTSPAAMDVAVRALHQSMRTAGHLLVVSRGASTPVAHEGALKIMETVGLPALSYSAADLEHGPIAFVRRGTPVLVLDSMGPAANSLEPVITRLAALGADIVQVGSAQPIAGVRAHVTVQELDPLAAPIAEAIPLQLLAYRLATSAGRDPDSPQGLSKVTLTR